ncbi:hypothetical protein AXF42_Ash004979 [Apostasia shenzhenica]|uniref:Uncharacterized protein n=1 Tax=Apostasia shenzhenica TaxID=1088818 RepID=A0A2I0B848_9ASPA|nr:hypothetical protein AXF42_Ash004979 [Apostasia shenzhenica]
MEGIIPFVYKVIIQYRNGEQAPTGASWYDSPSSSYVRLPGDSGRYQSLGLSQLFASSTMPSPAAAKQSPLLRSTSRHRS